MADQETYRVKRTDPNGDIVLEKRNTEEITKAEALAVLNARLKVEQQHIVKAQNRITRLQNRIATVTAL